LADFTRISVDGIEPARVWGFIAFERAVDGVVLLGRRRPLELREEDAAGDVEVEGVGGRRRCRGRRDDVELRLIGGFEDVGLGMARCELDGIRGWRAVCLWRGGDGWATAGVVLR